MATVADGCQTVPKTTQRIYILTQSKSKEIRQGSRRIIHHMELACLEHSIPIRSVSAKGFGNTIAEVYHAVGIVQSKYNSNYMDQRLASSISHYFFEPKTLP